MPIYAHKVSSLIFFGMPEIVFEAEAVYLAAVEDSILRAQHIALPTRNGAYEGDVGTGEALMVRGVDWFPSERQVLEGLIGLLPIISPRAKGDPAHLVLTEKKIPIVPFAYPLRFESSAGPYTGQAAYSRKEKVIYSLRGHLVKYPLRLLTILYHEAWHAVQDQRGNAMESRARELEAFSKQLELATDAQAWVETVKHTHPDAITNRGHYRDDLNRLIASLSRTLKTL